MQADTTVLSLRPGGDARSGRVTGPRFDHTAASNSDLQLLRPHGGGPASSLPAFKTAESRFDGHECIHYSRDQLMQLREVSIPDDILKLKQEVEAAFWSSDPCWSRGENNSSTQAQSLYSEQDNLNWHDRSAPFISPTEEKSWEAARDIELGGRFDLRHCCAYIPDLQGANSNAPSAQQPLPAIPMQEFRRSTDFLLENNRIMNYRHHHQKYCRYVNLYISEIFSQLVTIYATMFRSQSPYFYHFIRSLLLPAGVNEYQHIARIYISIWILDLWAYIREATRAISPIAYNERYYNEIIPYSSKYDVFLSTLIACFKPTHIQHASEDALYIPVLSENPEWDTVPYNPFGIPHFTFEHAQFQGILDLMENSKHWKMSPIPSNTLGRPFWLFDWHHDNRVCAWFPREANFTDMDVTLAYIIGAACTPKLGPRDIDDWRYFEHNAINKVVLEDLNRVVPRHFFGSYEVRTFETNNMIPPLPAV